jgi:hypothetical protein
LRIVLKTVYVSTRHTHLHPRRISLGCAWDGSTTNDIFKIPRYPPPTQPHIVLPALVLVLELVIMLVLALWKREGVFQIPLLVIRD